MSKMTSKRVDEIMLSLENSEINTKVTKTMSARNRVKAACQKKYN